MANRGARSAQRLTKIGATIAAEEIAESLLWPGRKVKPEFVAHGIETEDGKLRQGYIVGEEGDKLLLREVASCEPLVLAKSEIVERHQIGSLMPDGLAMAMSATERRDVVRFLFELGKPNSEALESLLGLSHQAAAFKYHAAPFEPEQWRFAGHPVNRDRLYDFYAKEADYFRELKLPHVLLPEYPGLDGGKLGHWGNQNEDTWRDGRWSRMDSGPVVSGIFQTGSKLLARGVCVRLGDANNLAACFNPETLTYAAVWQGGFLKYSAVRHGFVDALAADGKDVPFDAGQKPAGSVKYRGYYRHGQQVLFAYEVDGKQYLDAPSTSDGQFRAHSCPGRGTSVQRPDSWRSYAMASSA